MLFNFVSMSLFFNSIIILLVGTAKIELLYINICFGLNYLTIFL